ncbi:hypothetical protein Tco_1097975 [Tanacetum coccineum]
MSWFSRCSWCGGTFNGGNCRQCTNVSFGDELVRNPGLISNDEIPDFSYPPSQPQTSSFDQFHYLGCGDPLEDGVRCQQCTCKWCGYNLRGGFCLFCASRNGNSSIDAPNPNSFNDPPNVFTHPPQPQNESYSCELCGNDAHYGYDYPPWVPLVYEHEPGYDNYYLQNSPSFPQQYLNCEKCGGPHEDLCDVNPLFNEVLEDIKSKDSYVSNLDELVLLVTPLFNANEDECFDPGGDIDEIDAFLDTDISTDIENGCHDSDGDIIYLESLLIDDTIPNLPPKVFLDHDPRSLKDEPDNDDLKSMVKVFDLEIWENFFSPTYVRLPFEDRHYLSLIYVIRIFLPYLTYYMDSSLPLDSESEDTIFDPGISAFHFSSLEPVASHWSGTFMCFNVYLNLFDMEVPC